jgi:hypothetical protein
LAGLGALTSSPCFSCPSAGPCCAAAGSVPATCGGAAGVVVGAVEPEVPPGGCLGVGCCLKWGEDGGGAECVALGAALAPVAAEPLTVGAVVPDEAGGATCRLCACLCAAGDETAIFVARAEPGPGPTGGR